MRRIPDLVLARNTYVSLAYVLSLRVIRKQIEEGLALPISRIRQALRALDDSVLQSRLDLRLQSAAAEKRVDRL